MLSRKLAVAVKNQGSSELSWRVVRWLSSLAAEGEIDPVLLFEDGAPPCLPHNVPIFQLANAWMYDGAAIATSLSTAKQLLRFPSVRQKALLMWDLEWLRYANRAWKPLHDIYGHPDLELVARTEEHRQIAENAWNRPVKIISEPLDVFHGQSIIL